MNVPDEIATILDDWFWARAASQKTQVAIAERHKLEAWLDAQPASVPVDDIRLVCGYARAWGDCDVYPRVLAWLDSQRTDADGSDGE